MAVYTTTAGLQKRISTRELVTLVYDAGAVHDEAAAATVLAADSTVQANIAQAITDASIKIDTILNGILDLTDSTNQAVVEQCAAYIALYLLYVRRHNAGQEDNPHYRMMISAERDLMNLAKRKTRAQTGPDQPGGHAFTNASSTLGTMTDSALEHF